MSDCNDVSGKIKWQYLRVAADVVGTINEKNEYTLVKTKDVRPGDVVYIIQDDETFRKQLVIQLAVPQKNTYHISMKKIINQEGFRKAMRSGKTWVTLDCQISENEQGSWYWEIDKHVFVGSPEEGVKGGGDAHWEQLANGYDDDQLKFVGKIWDNFIEKYNPDEYFVDQDLA